jgi:hypothetical protein
MFTADLSSSCSVHKNEQRSLELSIHFDIKSRQEPKMENALTAESFEAWAKSLGQMRVMALDSARVRMLANLMPLTMGRIPYLGSLLHLAERLEREADTVQQDLPPKCSAVDLVNLLSTPKATLIKRLRAVKDRLADQRLQLQLLDDRIKIQEAEEEAGQAAVAIAIATGSSQVKSASLVGEALHKQRSQFAAAVEKLAEAQYRAARDLLVENLRHEATEIRAHITRRMLAIKEVIAQLAFMLVSATLAVGTPRDLASLKECFVLHDDLRDMVRDLPDVPSIVLDEQMMNRSQRSIDDKVKAIMESA